MNVLITGASKGLGLGFAQYYLDHGNQVWACYREDPGGLNAIDATGLHRVQWDVTRDVPADYGNTPGLPEDLHLVINSAGVYGPKKESGQSLETVTPEEMSVVFDVNCVGPLRVVQHLRNRLVNGRGVIANISSKMGSSADNTSGGCYAYRASKAALVIVSKSMAVDLQPHGVGVITLHPGWVRTDMTDHSGLIDVVTSVAGMTHVIDRIADYDLGAFVAFDGKVIPF